MRIAADLTALYDHLSGLERYAMELLCSMLRAEPDTAFDLYFKKEVHPAFSVFADRKNVRFFVLPEQNKLVSREITLPLAMGKHPADVYLFPAFPVPFFFHKKPAAGLIADLSCHDCPETMKKKMVWYFSLAFSRMARRTERIITISGFSMERIRTVLKVPSARILAVPCGLPERFRSPFPLHAERVSEIRKKYGLPVHFCLSLSTLEPRKNLAFLTDAYGSLYREGVLKMPLVLAGRNGWLIKELIRKTEQADWVLCPGFIEDEDLPAVYALCDCFLYPSEYEGFGLPPVEALSQGVPVISADAAALPETLENHALYFKSNDADDLKRVLRKIPSLVPARTSEAREADIRFSHRYDFTESAQILLKDLHALAAEKKEQPAFLSLIKQGVKRMLPSGVIWRLRTKKVEETLRGYHRSFDPDAYRALPEGINLVGDIRAEIGLGQSMRLLADALLTAKVPFMIYNLEMRGRVPHGDHSMDDFITDRYPYRVSLFHINPESFGDAFTRLPDELYRNRYLIGFWSWELEKLPPDRIPLLSFFDEIWTPSAFAAEAVRKYTDKPVRAMPFQVSAKTDSKYGRRYFGLPEDQLLYLVMYDSNSTALRKNPEGAIEAYKKAFPKEAEDAGLVIKMNNPTQKELRRIRKRLSGYRNVYIIDRTLPKIEANSLIRAADVLISLHRSEGFGLVPAEAMLNGTVCVATDWSANTEFMDRESAVMVSFRLIPVRGDHRIYPAGNRWADADIGDAAEKIRKLYEDKAYREALAAAAERKIERTLGAPAIKSRLQAALDEIFEK